MGLRMVKKRTFRRELGERAANFGERIDLAKIRDIAVFSGKLRFGLMALSAAIFGGTMTSGDLRKYQDLCAGSPRYRQQYCGFLAAGRLSVMGGDLVKYQVFCVRSFASGMLRFSSGNGRGGEPLSGLPWPGGVPSAALRQRG